jgi:hypothetical protein
MMQNVLALKAKPAGGGPSGIEPPPGPLTTAAEKFFSADRHAIEAEAKLRTALSEIDGTQRAVRQLEQQRAQLRGAAPRETADIELRLADAVSGLSVMRAKLADAQLDEQTAGELADEQGRQFATLLNSATAPIRDALRHDLDMAAANLRVAMARFGQFNQLIGVRERVRIDDMLELPSTGLADELAPWATIAAATSALLRRPR